MSEENPYSSPNVGTDSLSPEVRKWIRLCQVNLVLLALLYLALGLGCLGLILALFPMVDIMDEDVIGAIIAFPFMILMSLILGIAFIFVAFALGRDKKWAYYATLAIGLITAPSACFPFGGLILWGTLNKTMRERYLEGKVHL